MKRTGWFLHLGTLAACAGALWTASAADPIFSGPQPGEKTTPFRVLELIGPGEGRERDPIAENAGSPTALVFIHTIERSIVPLLRVVDQYGAERGSRLKTEFVFLSADRLEGEQRGRNAARSLQLKSRIGLSVDGPEGPGNYGLNKECMLTVVVAKDNQVTANFALVQPGISDAPKIIETLALASGDTSPPSMAQLTGRPMGGRPDSAPAMQGDMARAARRTAEPVDLSKIDLNSEAGVRDALRALIAEIRTLRAELTELRDRTTPRAKEEPAAKPAEDYPGAAPTDPRLNSLFRQLLRPTNDDATVDKLLLEVQNHIKGNPDLTQQAIDGWRRVLHFGDHYGTAHARKAGRDLLERHKSGAR